MSVEDYHKGFKDGMSVDKYIKQLGKNKMATMLIDKSDLNLLFPNEKQREAFLRIMKELVAVKPETDTIYEYCNVKYGTIRLENWPEGIVLWVGGNIVWKSWSV